MESSSAPKLIFLFLLPLLILCSTTTGANNPVTVTAAPGPPIITVPSGTPATVTPTPPTTVPPPTPVSPPTTVSPPVANNNPPTAMGPPTASGQGSWCVAKTGASLTSLQAALDFACGAGADCQTIQPGAACFNPNTLQNHASYAFSSYYQKLKGQSQSCDFGGVAAVTTTNPSPGGSCNYPGLSTTSTSPPSTTTPTTPPMTPMTPQPMNPTPPMTPTTGGLASPPTAFNGNNPPLGGDTGFGGNPQTSSTNSISSLQQPIIIGCVVMVTSIIRGVIDFDI